MVKITYKGETRDIPKRYIPDSLSPADRKKQIKSIFEGKKRPEVKYKEKEVNGLSSLKRNMEQQ